MNKDVVLYREPNGRSPVADWLNGLRDKSAVDRIFKRFDRVQEGNLGDHKSVGNGVLELRLAFGPGYRIYFGRDGDAIIVLLCGGDKSTQRKDIALAKAYWSQYLDSKKGA